MRISREEAIKQVGISNVVLLEKENVDFTNRLTSGTKDFGWVEFSASISCNVNGENITLTMYVFVDEDEIDTFEDLDQIDWDSAISKTAEYEIF